MTQAPPQSAEFALPDVPRDRIPRHIAIIMDGNGRWAKERNLPRIAGHQAGARRVRRIVRACDALGVEALTLYSFSMENWKRPGPEVDALMDLNIEYLIKEREDLIQNNVRLIQIGERGGLPKSVQREIEATEAATKHCSGMTMAVAINYGSRAEITDAVRAIAEDVKAGRIDVDDITEQTISDHLLTAGLPDPDLLIRTAGEYRISNYLLWQISYAEIHFTETFWPDFTVERLHDAIRDYASRDRRFGGLSDDKASESDEQR